MSETNRLLEKERPEKIDEHHEEDDDDGGGGIDNPVLEPAATTSGSAVLAKIRRRQSPPYGIDYGSTASKYGTLDTSAGMKRSLLVDTYPKTHITRKQFTIAFIAFLIFGAAVAVTLVLGLPRLDAKRAEYYSAQFYESEVKEQLFVQRSVVVTGSPECSRIGESILVRQNGTAMDAALAALFCSLVASPHLTRFDSALSGLYFRNSTTYSVTSELQSFPIPNSNTTISTPSLLQTATLLHRRFGKAPWATVLDPAIQLATSGVPVTRQLADLLLHQRQALLKQSSPIKSLFTKLQNNTSVPLETGDLLRIPGLAGTLNSIALNGTSQLYNGTIGSSLQTDLRRALGSNRSLDLLNPKPPRIEAPLSTQLLNNTLRLLTAPPPSSGVILSQVLSILDHLVISNESAVELCNDDNRTLKEGSYEFHYIIEALKFGYASSQRLSSNPKSTSISPFLDPINIQEIITKILDFSEYPEAEHSPGYYGFSEVIEEEKSPKVAEGAEIIVFDSVSGESVALTLVNRDELLGGEKILSESTGIILDKREAEDVVDQIYPTTPVLILDTASSQIRLASTSSGPESIPALAQVLYKIFYNCQEPKTAVDEARFFYSPTSDLVHYESTFPQAYIDLLTKLFAHYNLKAVKVDSSRAGVNTVLRLEQLSLGKNGSQGQVASAGNGYKLVSMADYRGGDAFADGD